MEKESKKTNENDYSILACLLFFIAFFFGTSIIFTTHGSGESIIETIAVLGVGIFGSVAIIRFAPGSAKIIGIPIGTVFISWGAYIAGII